MGKFAGIEIVKGKIIREPQYRDRLKAYYETKERLVPMSQLMEDFHERPRPQFGDWWGWWLYSSDGYINLYREGCISIIYYIKLSDYQTQGDIVSICFEMIHKRWVDPYTAGCLLIALCDIKEDEIKLQGKSYD
jgi:hypothetical protein